MHERELYDRLLGLSAPWFVADVNLDTEAQQVDVFGVLPASLRFLS